LQHTLRTRGLSAPDSLWGMKEPRTPEQQAVA
jgi:hypothetical protein